MKRLGVFLITVLSAMSVLGQTVYVNSSTGNDATGDGSAGNPYKTFHKGYTMASSGGTLDLTGTFTLMEMPLLSSLQVRLMELNK